MIRTLLPEVCLACQAVCNPLKLARELEAQGLRRINANPSSRSKGRSMLCHAGIATELHPTLHLGNTIINQVWGPAWAVPALRCLHAAMRLDKPWGDDAPKEWAVRRLQWLRDNPEAQGGFMTILAAVADSGDDVNAREVAGRWLCARFKEDQHGTQED